MTSPTMLKLVDAEDQDTLPFERRGARRYSMTGRVTAIRSKPDDSENTCKAISSLQLLDMSDGGLGVISQDPVTIGTDIVVLFPPHGPERGFDLYGQVVRCSNKDEGYEVGIRLRKRSAA